MPLPEDEANELLLLGLLRRGPTHGYALNALIAHDWDTCAALKKPTAYYLLKRMAQKGWVTWNKDHPARGLQRRIYRLTPEGEHAFWQLLRKNLSDYHPIYFAGDIGLSFLDALSPHEARDLLQKRLAQIQARRLTLENAPAHAGAVALALEHQRYHLAAEAHWLEHVLETLTTYISSQEYIHGNPQPDSIEPA
ncbi:MAG: PadR family transcriptional regulator [Thermanaerothrix sp.]|uniref:PadR family transcriptional regulator n=1 Tax=Thermanaerothrix sp. TaxID=2972675 RepID=UPI003C7DB208